MNISDQIIAILDDLCRRFGIIIDWTQDNIAPYLEELAAKFIAFELKTSWFWMYFILAITVVCWLMFIILSCVYGSGSEGAFIFILCSIVATIALFAVVGTQIYDIIACETFPEKILLRELKDLLAAAKTGY